MYELLLRSPNGTINHCTIGGNSPEQAERNARALYLNLFGAVIADRMSFTIGKRLV